MARLSGGMARSYYTHSKEQVLYIDKEGLIA